MKPFKAGIVQYDVVQGDVDNNIERVDSALSVLADAGVVLSVLPEMWSCGFDNENLQIHALKTPAILDALCKTARDRSMVIAGSLPELGEQMVYNTMYVIDSDGSVAGQYRKIHLFTPTGEHHYFSRGETPVICNTALGTVGLMICYDLRFPELGRVLTDMGASMLLISAQWPDVRKEHWNVLVRARAIENQMFVIASNRCGADPDLAYAGNSQIVSPWGELLARAGVTESNLIAGIDPNEVHNARKRIPCLSERLPEAYRVDIDD